MEKDFNAWNSRKMDIHAASLSEEQKIFFAEGEIWWCVLGINIGTEEDGKNEQFERPVLILKVFNRKSILIVPLTGKRKIGKYYFLYKHQNVEYTVILSQIRFISSSRLLNRMHALDESQFSTIRERIKRII
jgi:mRNA-degrading endonuclease toxin of MazEF toxin-antitoxin module